MENERDRMELMGTVVESNKGQFTVQTENGMIVKCTLAGKIRQNGIRVILGDTVKIEVSPFDTGKGRIVFRNKN